MTKNRKKPANRMFMFRKTPRLLRVYVVVDDSYNVLNEKLMKRKEAFAFAQAVKGYVFAMKLVKSY